MAEKHKLTTKSRLAISYFFRQRFRMVIAVIILGILYSVSETLSIGMLLPLLSQIVNPVVNPNSRVISFLFSIAESIPSILPIFSTLLIFFLATVLKNIFGYFKEVLSIFLGLSVREDCQSTLFHNLLRADYMFFVRKRLGDLEYRVLTAPNQMNNFVSIIPDIATEGFKCLLIILLLFIISPVAAIFIVPIGILFMWIIRYVSSRISYFTGKERVKASSDSAVYCGQALRGIKLLRIFKAERFWEELFNTSLSRFYGFAKRDAVFANMPSRLLETVAIGILCFVIGWVIVLYDNNNIVEAIPVLGVFVLSIQRMLPSLASIGRNSMLFMSLLPYGEATYDAMIESYESSAYRGKLPARFEREITFNAVSLKYDDSGDRVALNNISFSLKKNSLIAIVGESGSGKTSILNLLLKVLEPTSGEILLDGVPLKDINTDDWYSQLGYVGQEVFMFHGTIRDNVLFGMKDGNDKDVYTALEMANAMEFVERCNKGLDTIIGDDGIRLSGGQRQRLAIARALIRKPNLLIFDEATSAIDNLSEKLIKETIKRLHKHITIINVAHRSSTIVDADRIVVLKAGHVVEIGNFLELFQEGRYFKRLYDIKGNENMVGLAGIGDRKNS